MKKRMLYKLSWGILLAGLTACSDLTDSYKEYLDWGERVYAGKMDSVGVRPGRLRQQLDFFYSSFIFLAILDDIIPYHKRFQKQNQNASCKV